MDVTSINKHDNATKTDLNLLLECLKYQMKCPDSQKQALLTIYSICQQREENVDHFREMGGVVFVYNLSKSSPHSEVKETALFTLGTIAESNVSCKQALCRRETFSDLAACLTRDTPLTQRRVAVYLLSVLIANNRSGQTFAQTSGCLDILLDLFRTSFPLTIQATVKPANVTQLFQLWTSVSSALCGCVNNPQNEESQRICVSAFPLVKDWLQQLSLPSTEMVQPICSFIAMTVANNSYAQQSFSSVGGLETLTLTLIRLASDTADSPMACQLSVIMTKTLSACITDNSALASGLSQYGLVPQLLSLASSPNLDPTDRLSVILTLGHCTEACEDHQSQLLQCGGLSLIITMLTESHSEELKKAATFILQTCKQATVSLGGPAPGESQGQAREVEPPGDMKGYWRSAREMLHRIKQLERLQAQGTVEEWDGDTPMLPDQQGMTGETRKELPLPRIPLPPSLPPHPASLPCWEGTARGGDQERDEERGRRAEKMDEELERGGEMRGEKRWEGEESGMSRELNTARSVLESCRREERGRGGGGRGGGGEKKGEERGRAGERRCEEWRRELTPVQSVLESSGREERGRGGGGGEKKGEERGRAGEKRCEEWRRGLTLVRPVLERSDRDDERADWVQRESTEQHPTGGVRRQIFQASREPQKKSTLPSREQDREKRPHTHTHTHQEKESNRGGHTHAAYTRTHTCGHKQAEMERHTRLHTHRGRARDSAREAMRGISHPRASTLGERGKDTVPHTHACAHTKHHRVREQTHTPPASALCHAGAGIPRQSSDGDNMTCSMCMGSGTLVTSLSQPPEGARETHTESQVFKHPAPVKHCMPRPKKQMDDEDALSVCSELLDSELSKILETPVTATKPSSSRCSGCVLRFSEVTSRSFHTLQSRCHYRCDMHMVLQEATDRDRGRLRATLRRREAQQGHGLEQRDKRTLGPRETEVDSDLELDSDNHCRETSLTPARKGGLLKTLSTHRDHHKKTDHSRVSLTPMRRGALLRSFSSSRGQKRGDVSLTPLKKPRPSEDRTTDHGETTAVDNQQEALCMGVREPPSTHTEPSSQSPSERRSYTVERRERRNFSREEVCYLLRGVERFGLSWNSILWAYPFQPGRTNVDLAKKYKRLKGDNAQDMNLAYP